MKLRDFINAIIRQIDYMNVTNASSYSDVLTNYQFPDTITDNLSSMSEAHTLVPTRSVATTSHPRGVPH